jgi:hypothetical protein
MAEVFVQFSDLVRADDGRTFIARACGAEMDDHRWQGWIEFVPVEGGASVRSGRETTQPNRTDTEYWATGLTPVYLEGALQRALNPLPPKLSVPREAPVFDRPAGESVDPTPTREAVLNPFSAYRNGERLLRNQLSALSARHLVNIIEIYRLSDQRAADLDRMPVPLLVELIVSAVQHPGLRDSSSAERSTRE